MVLRKPGRSRRTPTPTPFTAESGSPPPYSYPTSSNAISGPESSSTRPSSSTSTPFQWPTIAVQPDERIHEHTTVTPNDVKRAGSNAEQAFRSNPKYARMSETLADRAVELASIFHEEARNGRTYLDRQRAETNLKMYVELYLSKMHPNLNKDAVLSSSPPEELDLATASLEARRFWKSATEFLCVQRTGRFKNAEHNQQLKNRTSADHSIIRLVFAFKQITGVEINEKVLNECFALAHHLCSKYVRVKTSVTWADLERIMLDTVFSNHAILWRNGMERLQFAALILVLLLTGARIGEIVRGSYQADCLKWKDLVWMWVINKDRTQVFLHLDLTIRLLKTMRTDPSKYRIQPLYTLEKNAPCLDAVLLVTALAKKAGIFYQGYNFDFARANALRALQQTARVPYLEIPTKEAFVEQPVFGKITKEVVGKVGTFGIDPDTPLNYEAARQMLRKVASDAGIDCLTFYCFRRGAIQALYACRSVREHDMQLSVGHRPGTSTTAEHYIPRRNIVDVQNVVMTGEESSDILQLHGLRWLPKVHLTPEEIHEVNQHPRVRAEHERYVNLLVQADAKADEAVRATTEQDKQIILAEAQNLRQQASAAQNSLMDAKEYFYKEKQQQVTEAEHKKQLVALGQSVIDDITSADDLQEAAQQEVDEVEENDTDQSGDQAADAILALGAEREEAYYLHGGTEDQLNSDSGALQAVRSVMTAHLPASEAKVWEPQIYVSLTEATSNVPDDQRSPMALALQKALLALKGMAEHGCPEPGTLDPRITSQKGTPLETIFQLLTVDNGTVNTLHKSIKNMGACTHCGQDYAKIAVTGSLDKVKSIQQHIALCNEETSGASAYMKACAEALIGHKCSSKKCCSGAGHTFDDNIQSTTEHVKVHAKEARKRNCLHVMPDGTACKWQSSWPIENPMDLHKTAPDLALHEEVVHGIFAATRYASKYCEVCQEWFYGVKQITDHSEQHLITALTNNGRSGLLWIQNLCPWCLYHDGLLPQQRAYIFSTRTQRNRHILQQHVFVVAQLKHMPYVQPCPCCQLGVHMVDMPEHLLSAHGISLAADRNEVHIGRDFSKLASGQEYGEAKEDVAAYKQFVQWASSFEEGVSSESGDSTAPPTPGYTDLAPSLPASRSATPATTAPSEASSSRATSPAAQKSDHHVASEVAKPTIRNTVSGSASRLRTAVNNSCLICEHDTSLPMGIRGRPFASCAALAEHIVAQHIIYERDSTRCCPACRAEMPAEDFAHHLQAHEVWLSGKRGVSLTRDLNSMCCASTHAVAFDMWLRWVAAGYPSTQFAAPNTKTKTYIGRTMVNCSPRTCPFCADAKKPASDPCNRAWESDKLRRHICSSHIFNDRQALRTCPECDERSIPAGEMPLHLESHNIWLSGKNGQSTHGVPGHTFNSHQANYSAWVDWCRQGCPEDGQKVPRRAYSLKRA